MAKSSKPLLWLPFAAGGLIAAFAVPALIVLTGVLLPLGLVHLPYAKVAAALHNPFIKLVMLGLVVLPAWHAAHRLRMTAHDLGLGSGIAVKAVCYGFAWLVIIGCVVALLMV
jgi:fumarate reductase subunit D